MASLSGVRSCQKSGTWSGVVQAKKSAKSSTSPVTGMARCLAAQRGVLRITVKAWRGFPFPRPSREANTSSTRPFGSATGEGTGTAPDAACLSLMARRTRSGTPARRNSNRMSGSRSNRAREDPMAWRISSSVVPFATILTTSSLVRPSSSSPADGARGARIRSTSAMRSAERPKGSLIQISMTSPSYDRRIQGGRAPSASPCSTSCPM